MNNMLKKLKLPDMPQMTIKNKVRLMLTMSVIGVVILFAFTMFYVLMTQNMDKKKVNLQELATETMVVKNEFSYIRNLEQEYLRTNREGVSTEITNEISELKKHIDKLQKQNEDFSKYFVDIAEQVKAYEDSFSSAVKLTLLDFNSMEQLDNKSNELIKKLKAADKDLLNEFYLLRILEKQYFISNTSTDLNRYNDQVKIVKEGITNLDVPAQEKSAISTGFLAYSTTIDTVESYRNQIANSITNFEEIGMNLGLDIETVEKNVVKDTNELSANQDRLSTILLVTLIILSLIIIGAVVALGFWLMKTITSSVTSLKEGATIIGEGHLGHRVTVEQEDEMGELAQTFNLMAEKMQKAMNEVNTASEKLSSSSQHLAAISEETTAQTEEVNEAIQQVSAGAQVQADHLLQSTELIDKVTHSVNETAELSLQISEDSQSAEQEGNEGLQIVEHLDKSSNEFLSLANHLIHQVQEANKNSQEIESIVDTIKDIASSTDLLALNAAIESARAGDAGRGFAVVAQEVRKLAERSKSEAQNIYKLIALMSEQMEQLSNEAEQFDHYRTEQQSSVERTKGAFTKIVGNVSGINNRIQQIRNAISQVQTSNTALSEKLQEVSAISQESVAASEEVSASSIHQKEAINEVNNAANELQDIAILLQEEVGQFNLVSSYIEELDNQDEDPAVSKEDATEDYTKKFLDEAAVAQEEDTTDEVTDHDKANNKDK
ncbi:methyl-accepting chemotaxis protein [Pseudalkalibacillus sp. SCS-8]|uniref:methyl-accepting chemotaxis protein n=1 Tax=Pseudalkalibacillus nanhaiensis TaxID=3115291 RepID=UPI0032DA5ABF